MGVALRRPERLVERSIWIIGSSVHISPSKSVRSFQGL